MESTCQNSQQKRLHLLAFGSYVLLLIKGLSSLIAEEEALFWATKCHLLYKLCSEQLQAVNFYKFTIKIASLKQSDKLTSPTYNDKLQLRDSVPAQQCQNNNLSRPQNHFAVPHPSQGIVRTEGVRRAETGGVKGGATHGSALRGVRSQE